MESVINRLLNESPELKKKFEYSVSAINEISLGTKLLMQVVKENLENLIKIKSLKK